MSYVVPRRGVGAFGAIDFNGPAVAADWQAGGARGTAAAKQIQAGLNEIGYGPLTVDGQFGSGSISAWNRFASANGVAQNWPDQPGILKLAEQVSAGGDQGGGGVQDYHVVNGQYVPGSSPGSSSGSSNASMLLGLGVAAVVGIGLLALVAKKRRGNAQMVEHKDLAASRVA